MYLYFTRLIASRSRQLISMGWNSFRHFIGSIHGSSGAGAVTRVASRERWRIVAVPLG